MQKTTEKITNSEITMNGEMGKKRGKTKARRIMETLFEFNRPMSVREIVGDTRLTERQVLSALDFLYTIKMITKNYENLGAKWKLPPRRTLKLSLSQSQFKRARRFLNR